MFDKGTSFLTLRNLSNEITDLLATIDKNEEVIAKLELKAGMFKAKAFGNEALYMKLHHQHFINSSNYRGNDDENKFRTLQMMLDEDIIDIHEYNFCID